MSPKSPIKPLARPITSIFRFFSRHAQTYTDKCRFFGSVKILWIVQNNIPAMNKLNKRRKANQILIFDFST